MSESVKILNQFFGKEEETDKPMTAASVMQQALQPQQPLQDQQPQLPQPQAERPSIDDQYQWLLQSTDVPSAQRYEMLQQAVQQERESMPDEREATRPTAGEADFLLGSNRGTQWIRLQHEQRRMRNRMKGMLDVFKNTVLGTDVKVKDLPPEELTPQRLQILQDLGENTNLNTLEKAERHLEGMTEAQEKLQAAQEAYERHKSQGIAQATPEGGMMFSQEAHSRNERWHQEQIQKLQEKVDREQKNYLYYTEENLVKARESYKASQKRGEKGADSIRERFDTATAGAEFRGTGKQNDPNMGMELIRTITGFREQQQLSALGARMMTETDPFKRDEMLNRYYELAPKLEARGATYPDFFDVWENDRSKLGIWAAGAIGTTVTSMAPFYAVSLAAGKTTAAATAPFGPKVQAYATMGATFSAPFIYGVASYAGPMYLEGIAAGASHGRARDVSLYRGSMASFTSTAVPSAWGSMMSKVVPKIGMNRLGGVTIGAVVGAFGETSGEVAATTNQMFASEDLSGIKIPKEVITNAQLNTMMIVGPFMGGPSGAVAGWSQTRSFESARYIDLLQRQGNLEGRPELHAYMVGKLTELEKQGKLDKDAKKAFDHLKTIDPTPLPIKQQQQLSKEEQRVYDAAIRAYPEGDRRTGRAAPRPPLSPEDNSRIAIAEIQRVIDKIAIMAMEAEMGDNAQRLIDLHLRDNETVLTAEEMLEGAVILANDPAAAEEYALWMYRNDMKLRAKADIWATAMKDQTTKVYGEAKKMMFDELLGKQPYQMHQGLMDLIDRGVITEEDIGFILKYLASREVQLAKQRANIGVERSDMPPPDPQGAIELVQTIMNKDTGMVHTLTGEKGDPVYFVVEGEQDIETGQFTDAMVVPVENPFVEPMPYDQAMNLKPDGPFPVEKYYDSDAPQGPEVELAARVMNPQTGDVTVLSQKVEQIDPQTGLQVEALQPVYWLVGGQPQMDAQGKLINSPKEHLAIKPMGEEAFDPMPFSNNEGIEGELYVTSMESAEQFIDNQRLEAAQRRTFEKGQEEAVEDIREVEAEIERQTQEQAEHIEEVAPYTREDGTIDEDAMPPDMQAERAVQYFGEDAATELAEMVEALQKEVTTLEKKKKGTKTMDDRKAIYTELQAARESLQRKQEALAILQPETVQTPKIESDAKQKQDQRAVEPATAEKQDQEGDAPKVTQDEVSDRVREHQKVDDAADQQKAEPVEAEAKPQEQAKPEVKTPQQAVEEIKKAPLSHVPGLQMGSSQAKGIYISTELTNRYETQDAPAQRAEISIENPFVVENDPGLVDMRNTLLQENIDQFTAEDFADGEQATTVDDLTEAGIEKLAGMVTENLQEQGYDSIYFPASQAQEGEVIVFDQVKVDIKPPQEVTDLTQVKPKEKATKKPSKEMVQAQDYEVTTPREAAMMYFIRGGMLNTSAMNELFGTQGRGTHRTQAGVQAERRRRWTWTNNTAKTIDQIAHDLWEEYGHLGESMDFKNALEDVITSYNHPQGMAKDYIAAHDIDVKRTEWERSQIPEDWKLDPAEQQQHDENVSQFEGDMQEFVDQYTTAQGTNWQALVDDMKNDPAKFTHGFPFGLSDAEFVTLQKIANDEAAKQPPEVRPVDKPDSEGQKQEPARSVQRDGQRDEQAQGREAEVIREQYAPQIAEAEAELAELQEGREKAIRKKRDEVNKRATLFGVAEKPKKAKAKKQSTMDFGDDAPAEPYTFEKALKDFTEDYDKKIRQAQEALDNITKERDADIKDIQAQEKLDLDLKPEITKKLKEKGAATLLPKVRSEKVFENKPERVPDFIKETDPSAVHPTQEVSVSDIIPTQTNLNIDNLVKAQQAKEGDEKPVLVKVDGKYYLIDGHHRVAYDILDGKETIQIEVYDADAKRKQAPAAEAKPDISTIRAKYGNTAYELVKKFKEHEGDPDYARMTETADKIISLGEKDKGVALAEALQYETVHRNSFEDFKRMIRQGDLDKNIDALKRMQGVGLSLPQDIVNAMQEAAKPFSETVDQRKQAKKAEYKELYTETIQDEVINDHYNDIEAHVKAGGVITDAVYQSLSEGKKKHFNKHYNIRGDKVQKAEAKPDDQAPQFQLMPAKQKGEKLIAYHNLRPSSIMAAKKGLIAPSVAITREDAPFTSIGEETQQSIIITPEISASVGQGVPLFQRTPAQQKAHQEVASTITELNKKTNLKTPVHVLSQAEVVDMMKQRGEDPASIRHVEAAFSETTTGVGGLRTPKGEVYIISDNTTRDEAISTWIHEVGVHEGLTRLIPNKADREHLLYRIYKTVGEKGFREIMPSDAVYKQYKNLPGHRKGDEYLAYLSQKMDRGMLLTPVEQSRWKKILNWIRIAIDRVLGVNAKVSEGTIRDIVRASVQTVLHGETMFDTTPAGVGAEAQASLADKKTITVDGKDRPTTNSEGRPIHTTEEGIRNFWRWFGDSKVVDDQGRPMVVYHGSRNKFNVFNENTSGIYFSNSEEAARSYYKEPIVYPVYLRIDKMSKIDAKGRKFYQLPGDQTTWEYFNKEVEKGSDGVAVVNVLDTGGYRQYMDLESDVYVVTSPNQIKSATANRGTFDAGTPSIQFSLKGTDGPVSHTTPSWQGDPAQTIAQLKKAISEISTKGKLAEKQAQKMRRDVVEDFIRHNRKALTDVAPSAVPPLLNKVNRAARTDKSLMTAIAGLEQAISKGQRRKAREAARSFIKKIAEIKTTHTAHGISRARNFLQEGVDIRDRIKEISKYNEQDLATEYTILDNKIAALEKMFDTSEDTPQLRQEVDNMYFEQKLLDMYGNLEGKSMAEVQKAIDHWQGEFERLRSEFKENREQLKAVLDQDKQALYEDVSGSRDVLATIDSDGSTQQQRQKGEGVLRAYESITGTVWSLSNSIWRGYKKGQPAREYGNSHLFRLVDDWAAAASEERRLQSNMKRQVEEIMKETYQTKFRFAQAMKEEVVIPLYKQVKTKDGDVDYAKVDVSMKRGNAIHLWLSYQSEANKPYMDRILHGKIQHQLKEDGFQALDHMLTEKDKEFGQRLLSEYFGSQEYYDSSNNVLEYFTGRSLPQLDGYVPVVAESFTPKLPADITALAIFRSIAKQRSYGMYSLDRNSVYSAALKYADDVSTFSQLAPATFRLASALNSRDVQSAAIANKTQGRTNRIIDLITAGYNQEKGAKDLVVYNHILRNFTMSKILLNYNLAPKQLISVITAFDTDFGDPGQILMEIWRYNTGTQDKAHVRAIKDIVHNHPDLMFRNILDIESLTQLEKRKIHLRMFGDSPSQMARGMLVTALYNPTSVFDRIAIKGGGIPVASAVYKQSIKDANSKGVFGDEAKQYAAERATRALAEFINTTQQSGHIAHRSAMQYGPARGLTMFMNAVMGYSRKVFKHARTPMRDYYAAYKTHTDNGMSPAEARMKAMASLKPSHISNLLLYTTILPVLFQTVTTLGGNWIRMYSDDEEERRRARTLMLFEATMGWTKGLAGLGFFIEAGIDQLMGQNWKQSQYLQAAGDMLEFVNSFVETMVRAVRYVGDRDGAASEDVKKLQDVFAKTAFTAAGIIKGAPMVFMDRLYEVTTSGEYKDLLKAVIRMYGLPKAEIRRIWEDNPYEMLDDELAELMHLPVNQYLDEIQKRREAEGRTFQRGAEAKKYYAYTMNDITDRQTKVDVNILMSNLRTDKKAELAVKRLQDFGSLDEYVRGFIWPYRREIPGSSTQPVMTNAVYEAVMIKLAEQATSKAQVDQVLTHARGISRETYDKIQEIKKDK
jgi:hypothetical protein